MKRYLVVLASVMALSAVGIVTVVSLRDGDDGAESEAAPPTPPPTILPATASRLENGVIVFASSRSGNFEIYRMAADGSGVRALTAGTRWDSWWPRVAPDRQHILFYRTPKGVHDKDYTQTALWVMNADGTEPTLLRAAGRDGWDFQGHAEWSPDGTQLVMFGGSKMNPQIHVTTAVGAPVRRVTKRGGVALDPSWSPDGRTIAFVGCPRAVCFPTDYEIYTVDAARVDATDATRLTTDKLQDQDPYFSRDGRTMAWLTRTSATGTPVGAWNIRLANPDGSAERRLTNDDRKVNSKPEWSLDGSLIYFHRMDYPKSTRFGVWSIRPDGSGLREITAGQPGVNEFPGA